jgi:hypothetical protein
MERTFEEVMRAYARKKLAEHQTKRKAHHQRVTVLLENLKIKTEQNSR